MRNASRADGSSVSASASTRPACHVAGARWSPTSMSSSGRNSCTRPWLRRSRNSCAANPAEKFGLACAPLGRSASAASAASSAPARRWSAMACIEASARKNGPAALFGPGRHDRPFRGRFALTAELVERRRAPPPRLDGQAPTNPSLRLARSLLRCRADAPPRAPRTPVTWIDVARAIVSARDASSCRAMRTACRTLRAAAGSVRGSARARPASSSTCAGESSGCASTALDKRSTISSSAMQNSVVGRDADCSLGQEMHVTQLRRAHARAPKRVERGIELVGRVAGPAERDEQLTAPERLRARAVGRSPSARLGSAGPLPRSRGGGARHPPPGPTAWRPARTHPRRGRRSPRARRLVAQRDTGAAAVGSGLRLQPLGESVALPSEDPALELAVVSGRRSHRDDGQPRAPRGVRDARADRTSKRPRRRCLRSSARAAARPHGVEQLGHCLERPESLIREVDACRRRR